MVVNAIIKMDYANANQDLIILTALNQLVPQNVLLMDIAFREFANVKKVFKELTVKFQIVQNLVVLIEVFAILKKEFANVIILFLETYVNLKIVDKFNANNQELHAIILQDYVNVKIKS